MLGYLNALLQGARPVIARAAGPTVSRMAGQAWSKLPVQLNPFRTAQPTTRLGQLGKALNPLNPTNVGVGAAATLLSNVDEKILPPEAKERLEYFLYGIAPGIAMNVLNAGAAGAKDEKRLIQESLNYFAAQKGAAPAPKAGPRVDASTTQAIQLGAAAPRQSAPVIPVTPTAPPAPVVSQAAYNAAVQGFQAPTDMPLSEFYAAQENIGRYAEQGGELQRRLKEAGAGAGMSDEALMAWAQKNPALAYRELMRREKKSGISVD
jgi:hypothetical protein